MKPTQKLELRQSQSLVMTAQLQQSIKLLQFSAAELNAFVEEELERNPLLTREDGEAAEGASGDAEQAQQPEGGQNRAEALDSNYGDGWQHDAQDMSAYHEMGRSYQGIGGARGFEDDERTLEQTVSSEVTLREHLNEQLHVDIDDPVLRMIGQQLIEMLDDGGYLRESPAELAQQLQVDTELVEATLAQLKGFDPAGVFAHELQECLALQLRERNWYDPMMACFLEHIQLLECGELGALQAACQASDEDFADMLSQIRLLDPFPARRFINDLAQPVVPDVFVRQGKDGTWFVELNHDVLPKVLVDQPYCQQLDTRVQARDDKKYISEQLAQANWLIRAIDQRAQSILKVSTEIIRQQEQFLLYGIQFLRPLTLKDISLQVDLHESTVSRVTTNKFISTPRGIFELKYFFTSSVSSSSGADDVSSKTVMFYIKELIDGEAPERVLSDDAIVNMLRNKNIDIARRTVAKYREAMHIPSSVIRRRQKSKN